MSSSVTAVRPRRGVRLAAPAQASEHRIRRRLYVAYGLLFFNTMTFYPGVSFIHIPSAVGKGLAQAALPVALLMALSVNRRVIVRPNVFLCLVSLLVMERIPYGPAARALRYRVPDLPARRLRGRALAADAVVGQA